MINIYLTIVMASFFIFSLGFAAVSYKVMYRVRMERLVQIGRVEKIENPVCDKRALLICLSNEPATGGQKLLNVGKNDKGFEVDLVITTNPDYLKEHDTSGYAEVRVKDRRQLEEEGS